MTFRDVYEKYWCPISPDIKPPQKNSNLVNNFDKLLSGWRYYFITISLISITLLSSYRIHFISIGLILIVSLSIHWLWGWAELPFLGSSVPMMAGGFVVSSLTTRIIYLIAEIQGLELLPWSGTAWIENSEINAAIATEWLGGSPWISIVSIFMSIVASFIVGGFAGWLIVRPGLGRDKVYVAIISYVLVDAVSWIITGIGVSDSIVFLPDVFVFAGDNGIYLLSCIILMFVFIGLFGYDRLRNSRFGLDVRTNPDIRVLGRAVFLGCGSMGIAGCLLVFYYTYLHQGNFVGLMWYWPLIVFLIAGSNSGTGLLIGVLVLTILQYLIRESQVILRGWFFFPSAYAFQIETALVILLACFYYLKRVQTKKPDPFKEAIK